mgnify:CR=1 FL=1
MAIELSKKQSDLEKRLKLLRQQVYGKNTSSDVSYNVANKKIEGSTTVASSTSDIAYLYRDLLKIAIFTSLAIGIQIILYLSLPSHVLNLNFS